MLVFSCEPSSDAQHENSIFELRKTLRPRQCFRMLLEDFINIRSTPPSEHYQLSFTSFNLKATDFLKCLFKYKSHTMTRGQAIQLPGLTKEQGARKPPTILDSYLYTHTAVLLVRQLVIAFLYLHA